MAKTQKKTAPKRSSPVTANVQNIINNSVETALMRQAVLSQLLGGTTRDLDAECGYPSDITTDEYKRMYDRQGIGTRVVKIFPEESWATTPAIYETEDSAETEFEKRWIQLEKEKHIFSYLSRVDILSGVGRYGILLLGISDGKTLDQPVEGINEKTGEKIGKKDYKLTYVKPFSEAAVTIDATETDPTSPRYGFPTMYSIQMVGQTKDNSATQSKKVHWTRVVHVADNREESDMYGTPRLKDVYNYCLDVKKILGGSGEMFWKGGFPGLQFTTHPPSSTDAAQVEVDTDAITTALESYQQSLQRFLIGEGGEFKNLSPQVADPSNHLVANIKAIAMAKGVPYRIFLGSEEAKLASTQDKETWNGRIMKRQNDYLTPFVIRPLIDRLIAFGVLPEVVEYFVDWPDLNTPTEKDKAEVAKAQTESIAKYVMADANQLIPPFEYLTMVLGMSDDEAKAIEKAAERWIALEEPDPDTVDPNADPNVDPNQQQGGDEDNV